VAYRKEIEVSYWKRYPSSLVQNSKENLISQEDFEALVGKRLADNPELLGAIVPDFSPHYHWSTPGPGYLEALGKKQR
jgi:hypothetical protein